MLPEEYEARAWPTQRLVRRRRHNVGVGEGVVVLLRRHQSREVRHVHHEERPHSVACLAVARIVPVERIRRSAGDNKLRLVHLRRAPQTVVVDHTGRCDAVRQRLEENGARRDAAVGGVVAVREVSAGGEV
ncbi:hypothetical protein DQ04_20271000 [Trypanosoma grayi]|uniref:hypothetical protein n=1 Tax=Trypanosoma grayi TaxID=71804 RepID=UPI0004F420B3|nr:hypothetical protein DQ04_20271000 [Trypanosoma grayi]KEG05581.1 hypothetical protein DQ04_20271000 [Trypanosoma grayi]